MGTYSEMDFEFFWEGGRYRVFQWYTLKGPNYDFILKPYKL